MSCCGCKEWLREQRRKERIEAKGKKLLSRRRQAEIKAAAVALSKAMVHFGVDTGQYHSAAYTLRKALNFLAGEAMLP